MKKVGCRLMQDPGNLLNSKTSCTPGTVKLHRPIPADSVDGLTKFFQDVDGEFLWDEVSKTGKASIFKTAATEVQGVLQVRQAAVCGCEEWCARPRKQSGLRNLIERAKKDQVPSHVIEKAIEKSQRALVAKTSRPYRYEGFAPVDVQSLWTA